MEGHEPAPESAGSSMTSNITPYRSVEGLERVLLSGDLSHLNEQQAVAYYARVCESLGLNPLTQPFEYLYLNGKMILYARRSCTNQLRQIHEVSIKIVARETSDGIYSVTAQATLPNGRCDESEGSVSIEGLKGEALSNARMRAETKAKRRVTLDICGLATLDESELDGVAGRARSAPRKAPSSDTFPLASLPAEEASAAGAAQAPIEAAPEPDPTPRRPAIVLPFTAAQAGAAGVDPVAQTALALFGPKLRARMTAEELVGWMREVIAHDFEPVAKRALFNAWSQHVKRVLPGADPNELLQAAKKGGQ